MQSRRCGMGLGFAFAAAMTCAQRFIIPIDLRGEGLGVVWPAFVGDFVTQVHGTKDLANFLEVAFGVSFIFIRAVIFQSGIEMTAHKTLRGLQTAIEKNGSEHSLNRIS